MSDQGNIRNLEQLEEDEDERKMPRGVTMAFVGLGGACIAFAAMALGGRTSQSPTTKTDPLGELVASRAQSPSPATSARPATELSPKEVTFPEILSDENRASTALAAVRPNGTAATVIALPAPTQPPPPTDRLPVVPLPAQAVLEATPIVTRPRDPLTKAASDIARIDEPPTGDASPPGHEGGYQLQVSSFRTQGEATSFADQLRSRGHKAYIVEAHVPGRGTWFRVRIGPFGTQHAAAQYRSGFEDREHVVPFIVPPETTAKAH